jgi:hypothetical protein
MPSAGLSLAVNPVVAIFGTLFFRPDKISRCDGGQEKKENPPAAFLCHRVS